MADGGKAAASPHTPKGLLVNNNCATPPGFFVNVASKGFSVPVSDLESTLVAVV